MQLRGAPSGDAPANLTLFAGLRTATGCNGYPAIGLATQTDLTGASWVRLDAAQAPAAALGTADKLYAAEAEEYEATAAALAGRRPNCVVARRDAPGDTSVLHDEAGPSSCAGSPSLRPSSARCRARCARDRRGRSASRCATPATRRPAGCGWRRRGPAG